jgi:hypothetical protein
MDNQLMWILAALGALALIGVFVKMTKGFGPFNLRVIGIVLIATFASLLGFHQRFNNGGLSFLGPKASQFLP